MQGAWVRSLVGELGSPKPCGTAKKKKKNKELLRPLIHHPRAGEFTLLIKETLEVALPRQHVCGCMHAQSCPTLRDPMDSSPAGSSVLRIILPRILEWVATSSSRGSGSPRCFSFALGIFATLGKERPIIYYILWTVCALNVLPVNPSKSPVRKVWLAPFYTWENCGSAVQSHSAKKWGSNRCLLYWWEDSLPLSCLGSLLGFTVLCINRLTLVPPERWCNSSICTRGAHRDL